MRYKYEKTKFKAFFDDLQRYWFTFVAIAIK